MSTSLPGLTPQRKQVKEYHRQTAGMMGYQIMSLTLLLLLCNFLYGVCCCVCSEQTAGRQRESGSSSGELLAAGGGQPVPDHQEHLSSLSALSSSAFSHLLLQQSSLISRSCLALSLRTGILSSHHQSRCEKLQLEDIDAAKLKSGSYRVHSIVFPGEKYRETQFFNMST